MSPLQLSSFALHVSGTGTCASQSIHLPLSPSHVSDPSHWPSSFLAKHVRLRVSRLGPHGHDPPLFGTHHLYGTPEGGGFPIPASSPESAPESAPASGGALGPLRYSSPTTHMKPLGQAPIV